MTAHPLKTLTASVGQRQMRAITSVCSAHPVVIRTAVQRAGETNRPLLIEATCNQVNQDGGYTGMTAADFRRFVGSVTEAYGVNPALIVLGGDHLGPNPWRHLPADEAMDRAEAMIAQYTQAGFTKLHLDTSMGCAGEPAALSDEITADRAARLCAAAEASAGTAPPCYVIGTEVPVPGGTADAAEILTPTTPDAAARTWRVHADAFGRRGLSAALERVIAMVVQPGVEFGHSNVIAYDAAKAAPLSQARQKLPGIVFEAHSTDYQSATALSALARDGFAILKVGPELTFALREALYGLDAIADCLDGHAPRGGLMATMDRLMRARPDHWAKYYTGHESDVWRQRHFSLSDRIRYYWSAPEAVRAVDGLLVRLRSVTIPGALARQYLGAGHAAGADTDVEAALAGAVTTVLMRYERAATPPPG